MAAADAAQAAQTAPFAHVDGRRESPYFLAENRGRLTAFVLALGAMLWYSQACFRVRKHGTPQRFQTLEVFRKRTTKNPSKNYSVIVGRGRIV